MTPHQLILQRLGPPLGRPCGAVAASLASALVVCGLTTATVVLAFAIAQSA